MHTISSVFKIKCVKCGLGITVTPSTLDVYLAHVPTILIILVESILNQLKIDMNIEAAYNTPVMSNEPTKSHLLDAIQYLILLENRPDYIIAAKCGVAPSTILNIRHGNHSPSVHLAEHIYETLSGFSLADFELL